MVMRTLRWVSHCAACALFAASPSTSHGAESSPGAPLPGLTSDEGSKVAVESCSVTLSGKTVSVELSVRSLSPQPALLIEGPLFGPPGESEAYPDRHFPELEVRIDGALLTLEDHFEAFMGRSDITAAIRDAGMDPWAITRNPPLTPVRPDSRVLKTLERVHAVRRSEDQYLANWTARRVVRIPLEPSVTQRIELHYRGRPAFTDLPSDQLLGDERETAYCLSAKQASALLQAGSSQRLAHIAEYSIATGVDGRPAATVMLTKLDGGAAGPRAVTFACGPHGKSIAVAGSLTRRSVQTDAGGNLRILEVTEP